MEGAITILRLTCRRSTRERARFSPTNMFCRRSALVTVFSVVSKSQGVTGVTQKSSANTSLVLTRYSCPSGTLNQRWCKEYEEGKKERKEWSDLMKPMTMDEFVEAVKSVQAGKAA